MQAILCSIASLFSPFKIIQNDGPSFACSHCEENVLVLDFPGKQIIIFIFVKIFFILKNNIFFNFLKFIFKINASKQFKILKNFNLKKNN